MWSSSRRSSIGSCITATCSSLMVAVGDSKRPRNGLPSTPRPRKHHPSPRISWRNLTRPRVEDFDPAAGEQDADGQTANPGPGPNIADLTPWRVRPRSPNDDEDSTERFDDNVSQQDDENSKEPERAKSAQARGELIVRGR